MWKVLAQSVPGTSHRQAGVPCQDHCRTDRVTTGDDEVLILACADGAGSAAQAEAGASLACEGVLAAVRRDLEEGQSVARIDRDSALSWLVRTRAVLTREAAHRGVVPRDLATTLLVAVVGEREAAFAQIGDGAIVRWDDAEYETLFWPATGEYANTTCFLTDAGFDRTLEFRAHAGSVDELALLTDGLQRLALEYESRRGHRPFFEPLFRQLRSVDTGNELVDPLRQFLDSPRINQRSDDDKTLILATRVPARADVTDSR